MIRPRRNYNIDEFLSLESLQEKLVKAKCLTRDQLRVISEEKRTSQKTFLQLVTDLGFMRSPQLKQFIVDTYQLYPFSLKNLVINPSLLKAFPRHLAETYKVFPFHRNEEGLHVALADINDFHAYDTLRDCFDLVSIIPYVGTPEEVLTA